MRGMKDIFRHLAQWTSRIAGTPKAFFFALLIVAVWAVTGPVFNYSDTWQLVINTGTTILTFLMVFLIQNTQNRDSHAIHLKLDELIRAIKSARNELIDVEDEADEKLEALEREFERVKDIHPELRKPRKS